MTQPAYALTSCPRPGCSWDYVGLAEKAEKALRTHHWLMHGDAAPAETGRAALDRMDAGEPQQVSGRERPVPAKQGTPASPPAKPASRPERSRTKWTRPKVLAELRAFADQHGHTPPAAAKPALVQAARRLFGSLGAACEQAGFPRPQRGKRNYTRPQQTQPEDSSGEGAASQPAARGHARPVAGGEPDGQQPALRAPSRAATDGTGAPEPRPAPNAEPAEGVSGERRVERLGPDGRRSPETTPELTLGLTLDQFTAVGEATQALSRQLAQLDRPDRQAVWSFIKPLIEEALGDG